MIKNLNETACRILLVERNVMQSLELSKRAYVLSNGDILLQGASKGLLENPEVKCAYIRTY